MKKQVRNTAELRVAIEELELIAAAQKKDIQETYREVSENLKPFNLVKSGLRTVFSGEMKEDIVNALIGLGTGFLSRKMILGRRNGIVAKTAGMALEWGMAALVSKNAARIKEKAGEWIDKIFKKTKHGKNHTPAAQITQKGQPGFTND